MADRSVARYAEMSARADDLAKPIKSQLLHINMGPQHPATHGVLRLFITTDGEVVNEVVPYIGYLHRCAEKIAEGNTYGALGQTTRPGVFVAGSATGPETIDDSIAQGKAAAMAALEQRALAARLVS